MSREILRARMEMKTEQSSYRAQSRALSQVPYIYEFMEFSSTSVSSHFISQIKGRNDWGPERLSCLSWFTQLESGRIWELGSLAGPTVGVSQ